MKYNRDNNQIIQLDKELFPLQKSVGVVSDECINVVNEHREIRRQENDLIERISCLSKEMGISVDIPQKLDTDLTGLNFEIEQYMESNISSQRVGRVFPQLSSEEIIFSSVTGFLAVIIDVVFVGTPIIKKQFNGSILTDMLRKIGNGKDDAVSNIFHWLSDKCKVPYDISAVTDTVIPNNHRLRSLAHDPFFGLLFAVADIIMGTTTCINNEGYLTVLVNKNPATMYEKLFSVFYYIGHIFSDLCTVRGIPIPGFFLTQFFTDGDSKNSIARIAENMYKNGYDIRHMISMSVPVYVKNLLIDAYLRLTEQNKRDMIFIAEKEYADINSELKREKMLFISNTVAIAGNIVKFLAPPNRGNPCALNAVQWAAFIRNGINMLCAVQRDRTTEIVIEQRNLINQMWEELLLGI